MITVDSQVVTCEYACWHIVELIFACRIGFVTQDDVLFTHLTVKETLTYAALLRLPKTMTQQQKKERAMDIIHELGLER
jgi:ABC-type multidrug transport system ATPase subunit